MSDNQLSEEEKKEAERKAQEEKIKAQGGEVTPPIFKCTVCGDEFKSEGAISAHSLRSHRDPTAWKGKKPEEPKKGSIYRGEVDQKEILHKILDNDPDLSPKHIDEVIRWAEFSTVDPFSLTHLLTTMKDIKQSTATRIGFKYQAALSSAKGQGPPSYPSFVSMFQQQGGGMPWSPSFPAGPQREQGHDESRGLSRGDIVEIIRSLNKERELEEAKREIEVLRKGGGSQGGGKAQGVTIEDIRRLNEEQKKKENEEKEKTSLTQTLDRFGQVMDNLITRVSAIEQGGGPKKPAEGSEKGPGQIIMDTLVNDYADKIKSRSKEVEGKMVVSQDDLRSLAKEMKSSPIPEGITPVAAEIEIARIQADAARATALEKRRGNETIAGAINSFAGNLGKGVIDAYERNRAWRASQSSGKPGTQPRRTKRKTPQQVPETIKAEGSPVPGKDGKPSGLLEIKCPTKGCGGSITYEEGTSHPIRCPKCGSEFQISPRE